MSNKPNVNLVEVKEHVLHQLAEPTRALVQSLENGVPVTMLAGLIGQVHRALFLAGSRTPKQVSHYLENLQKERAAASKAENAAAAECIARAIAIGTPVGLTLRVYGGTHWSIHRDGVKLAASKNPREILRRMAALARTKR